MKKDTSVDIYRSQREWRIRNLEKARRIHRESYHRNKEKWKSHIADYNRHNILHSNGRSQVVRKRRFLGTCELCGNTIPSRPQWHHWNDGHPEWGLWLCGWCHQSVESDEKGRIELYRKLKELIENDTTI